jgi:hypothetical protein
MSGIKDGAKECENVTYFGKISHKQTLTLTPPLLWIFQTAF